MQKSPALQNRLLFLFTVILAESSFDFYLGLKTQHKSLRLCENDAISNLGLP